MMHVLVVMGSGHISDVYVPRGHEAGSPNQLIPVAGGNFPKPLTHST
ncbi:hypothetical protein FHR32_005330 [Streptosporangium album]|uniref:Uncharacterized protein n=1 Tax=Streptosporangium album TaxID=47479 RepID=A0A7W7RZ82_9ACTN|nr:hypothetical protein [Streptosporangium album]